MSRFATFLFLLVWSAGSAFSADPPAGTTTSPDEIDPVTGLSRSTVVRPLRDAPPPLTDMRAQRGVAQTARPHVAIILPTISETLGPLAEMLRQGFAAGAEVVGRQAPDTRFTAVENEAGALLQACRDAVSSGATLVVGGITRDGATALARSDCARQLVLALNEPSGSNPPNVFSISLSLEHEARQVALMAVAEGLHSAIVIASPSPLAKRVQDAFEREWIRAAGELRARINFAGALEDAPAVREHIAAVRGADMVFFALDPPEARAVRPYVSAMLPVFATSLSVNPRAEAIVNVDLQGVRYVEMPWFVQPDHPAVMVYPQVRNVSVERERLYAFGIDAFRLALQVMRGDRETPLDGVTGKIVPEGGNIFSRVLVPAEVDGGRVIPLRAQ